jgi:hypothetical protein
VAALVKAIDADVAEFDADTEALLADAAALCVCVSM